MNLNFLYQGAGPLKHVALDPAPWCTYRQFVKGKKAKIFLLVIELAFWRKGIILIDRLTDTSSLVFIQSFWRKSSYTDRGTDKCFFLTIEKMDFLLIYFCKNKNDFV